MVNQIYELKNKLLEDVMKEVRERGTERLDGEKIDMIKDLAEAEKSCWEAEYYRKVSEAMESKQGYNNGMSSGYGNQGQMTNGARQGYGSMGHGDLLEKIGSEFQKLNPEERMMFKSNVLSKLGSI